MHTENTYAAQGHRSSIDGVCDLVSGELLSGLVHVESHMTINVGVRVQTMPTGVIGPAREMRGLSVRIGFDTTADSARESSNRQLWMIN